ncbi:uncharacterized protein LOC119189168 [Manduca sexta]|uniref:uncharacterized protein LOC119189168 n=1 Tax=Manduca sexta TaxID=7130 RepID=UPI00188DFA8E|nr:uncharacterized protein LOC119189168 [Manduca sexta]
MEDTLLIVMGDHGAKYDTLRKTYQGRIEERLPLVAVRLPSKLVKARPRALASLKANAEVLTSPYDLHTTLLDVVGLMKHKSQHYVPGSDLPRGMSWLGPIPKSRSCGEAGILPHWCACAKWRNMSTSNVMYKKAAAYLLDYINNMTRERRDVCLERTLQSIQWVLIYMPHREMLKKVERGMFGVGKPVVGIDKRQYQVKIVTDPADGMFEASMVYYVRERYFMMSEKDVSRINAYGHEPHCIEATHPHLLKYCYCNNTEWMTETSTPDFNKAKQLH